MVKLSQYFWNLVEQLPSLLTMLGCMVFAFLRWKRHPKVSLMVVLGLGLLFLHVIVFLFVYDLIPPLFIRPENYLTNAAVRRNVFLVLGLISNTVAAVAYAVLLAGVFMQRTRAPQFE
jgi:hypothetical protein